MTPSRRRGTAWLQWCGQAVAWLVVLGIGALLVVALVVPRLAGATPYVIETGSMRPEMPPGTMVVVKHVDPDTVAVGDVITFQLHSGEPEVVTHRVVAQGYDMTGQLRWRTKGDANGSPDEGWVRPVQLRGRLWYAVPYVGYVTSLVTDGTRQVVTGLLVAGLLGYALLMFALAYRERRRRRAGEPTESPADADRVGAAP